MATIVGGLAVGVPGELRGMELVHRELGNLSWPAIFQPIIRMAEEGFVYNHQTFTTDMRRRQPNFQYLEEAIDGWILQSSCSALDTHKL